MKLSKLQLILPLSWMMKFVKWMKKLHLQTQNPPVWLILKQLSPSVLVPGDLDIYLTVTLHGSVNINHWSPPLQEIAVKYIYINILNLLTAISSSEDSSIQNKVVWKFVCARLAQLVRSLTTNRKVLGSIPGLVMAWTLYNFLLPHRPWTGTF